MLPTKFQVNWPFGTEEEEKYRFSTWPPWRPAWIFDRKYFSYFLYVTRCFLQSSESNGLLVHENKRKIDFQDGGHLGFPIGIFFKLFLIYKSPWFFLPSFESIGLLVQEKQWKIDIQDGHHGGHLGFPIRMILAIFDLQVTPMLPTKFQVNWPFGSGEEVKNRFSRCPKTRPSWISDRNEFSYFWSTSHPDASYQVSSPLGCRSRPLKQLLTPHDGRQTLTDHNSSPWALRAQVS